MDNKNIAKDILERRKQLNKQPETLEEIAKRVAAAYRKEQPLKQSATPTKVELNEKREAELIRIVTEASHADRPENSSEFLAVIPDLHYSWQAIKLINKNTHLQKVYTMVMLAIYQEEFPVDAETRILCLDDVDEFVVLLNNCGHNWSRKALTIMRTQHPKVYHLLFEQTRTFDSYIV